MIPILLLGVFNWSRRSFFLHCIAFAMAYCHTPRALKLFIGWEILDIDVTGQRLSLQI